MPKLIEDARHRASAPSHDGEGASPRPTEPSRARCRARAKTLLTILAALVLAPLTVVVGMGIPGNGYYLSGTLIVLYAIVPFFVAFEGRRPTAREIAVVAVLTALAVAARAAFVWVPHFKPMAAIMFSARTPRPSPTSCSSPSTRCAPISAASTASWTCTRARSCSIRCAGKLNSVFPDH